MNTIWKFPLSLRAFQRVSVPKGAQVLSVQMQQETPTLWALVSTDAPLALWALCIVGTGQELPVRCTPET